MAEWLAGRLADTEADALLPHLTPDVATYEQFVALLNAVRPTVIPLPPVEGDILDCCGTGGSGRPHFNVSTTVAFVLATAGVRVVKFGNRAATSTAGSFDLLERLGVPVEYPPERISDLLEATNLAFLYAPQCYPALKLVAAARRRFGRPTLFNYIGPLLHPLWPARRLVGVSHPRMQVFVAQWLADDPRTRRALVVRSEDNSDELAPRSASVIYNVTHRHIVKYRWSAAEVESLSGVLDSSPLDYAPETNVKLFWRIVAGADTASFAYHSVCLNAGLGFVAAGRVETLAEGAELAAELLAGGCVKRHVEAFLARIQTA